MNPRLIATSGPSKGKLVAMTGAELTVGRVPSNDLSIAEGSISRRHFKIAAELEAEATQFKLTDLTSANGTFINGVPVKERVLAHGDVIKIGDSSLLFLCHEEDAPADLQSQEIFDDEPLDQRPTVAILNRDSRYLNDQPLPGAPTLPRRLVRNVGNLLRISRELSSLRELEALQQRLFEMIGELVPAEHGAILISSERASEPEAGMRTQFTSVFEWRRDAQLREPFKISRTIVERVLREGAALLHNDVKAAAELSGAESLLQSGIRSVMAAPLTVAETTFGVLFLDTHNPASSFDADQLELVKAIAEMAAPSFDNVSRFQRLHDETSRLRKQLTFDREMIGESQPMLRVHEFISRAASTDSNVLISGENGTGKELVARAIHVNSVRAGNLFIAINCAAIPESLFESEMFGHEKGSFTGAFARRIGRLEAAQGGTVFLDEIGELAQEMQVKLLRVLQEREFERVGGTTPIKLDIRLIAATNIDIKTALETHRFREDFYYRLNVFSLEMPPLRDRREDIPLIAAYFTAKFAEKAGRRIKGLSPAARACLLRHDWPGNVRELENAIERAVGYCSTDFILPDDLPDNIAELESRPALPEKSGTHDDGQSIDTDPAAAIASLPYRDAVREARKQIVLHAFEQAGGNHQKAARLLGLHRNNLHRVINELGLRPRLKKAP